MKYSQIEIDKIKRKIPQLAFEMFSKNGIENVSMQNIADAAKIGFATIYRYYGSKEALVLDVAAKKWNEYALHVEKMYNKLNGEKFTAKEELEFYIDCYIDLYKNHKKLLKFSYNFDSYISGQKVNKNLMSDYNKAISFFINKFHIVFIKNEKDKTIRNDIPEEKVFFSVLHSMLSSASKFACRSALYPIDNNYPFEEELQLQKEVYMDYMTKNIN